MDDVRIFGRALTEREILFLASGGSGVYGDANQNGLFNLADLVKVVRWEDCS